MQRIPERHSETLKCDERFQPIFRKKQIKNGHTVRSGAVLSVKKEPAPGRCQTWQGVERWSQVQNSNRLQRLVRVTISAQPPAVSMKCILIQKSEHPEWDFVVKYVFDIVFDNIALLGVFYLLLPLFPATYFEGSAINLKV